MATLDDLGLSEYEARAYRALLTTGPTTAKEVSRSSDVPMGRIYDVLNSLEAAGMVRSQDAGRPKKYVAVEPESALDRLLEDRKEELRARIEQYEAAVEELVEQLDAGEPTGEQFWTVAVGAEETVDLLADRYDAATERIVTIVSMPSSGFNLGEVGERFADRIAAALDRGVEVRALVDPELVQRFPDDVVERYEELIANEPGYEVRLATDVAGSFTLIDRTEVCIEVPNPLAPDEPFALIDLTDPEFAADVYEEFEPRWERAERFPP